MLTHGTHRGSPYIELSHAVPQQAMLQPVWEIGILRAGPIGSQKMGIAAPSLYTGCSTLEP